MKPETREWLEEDECGVSKRSKWLSNDDKREKGKGRPECNLKKLLFCCAGAKIVGLLQLGCGASASGE